MQTAIRDTLYQVLILDRDPALGRGARLQASIEARARDLGLDPGQAFLFTDAEGAQSLRGNAPWVTVVFGGLHADPAMDLLVKSLVENGRFVLPVVPTTDNFPAQVPPALRPINAFSLNPADTTLTDVAARVFEEFRLLRHERKVFISYRRDESRAVALQLFQHLEERGFSPFLDTHRITTGVDFQESLMDELSDADVVVMLDTPRITESHWAMEEIRRAGHLGVGILQVLWPIYTRSEVSSLADPLYLDPPDFEDLQGRDPDQHSRLTLAACDRLTVAIENLRARSFAARRTRVIEELHAGARAAGIPIVERLGSHIEVQLPRGTAYVIPVVGHPSAMHCNTAHIDFQSTVKEIVLLHDTLGAHPRRLLHLSWLNEHLPVRTVARDRVAAWMR
ncbi:MAG: toll/interleukin-1 receptor domain-containing protein [Myxococcales bacterium]|nr:toll/interleukin-1 receptor domain-containing protein [Myxococcales bacterium]